MMPSNPLSSSKRSTKTNKFPNEVFMKDDRIINEEESETNSSKKFMMISDPNYSRDGFLDADETRLDELKSNGKKVDPQVNSHSLKVTIKRMSQKMNSHSPNDSVKSNEHYECRKNSDNLGSKSKVDNYACTASSATYTEPDLLGPCEPGTKIVLDATVWLETQGMLIINANWRGKCFLGTLIDASKNSLGPNCPDKSMSALSLMKNRSWRGTNTRGGRGGHFSRNKQDNLLNETTLESLLNPGITTRSAKAAAVAASTKNPDSQGLSSESEMSTSSSVNNNNKRNPDENDNKSNDPNHQKRRSKRRRNTFSKTELKKICTKEKDIISDPKSHDLSDGNIKNLQSSPSETLSKNYFMCPNDNCGKEFATQISLRFHLQLGHPKAKEPIKKVMDEKFLISEKKPTRIKEYEFDDDAPPQLQEEIPIEDPKDNNSQIIKNSNKFNGNIVANGFNESSFAIHMPTASPAYSDISDDEVNENKNSLNSKDQIKKVINESIIPPLLPPDPSTVVNINQIPSFKSFDLSNDIERSKNAISGVTFCSQSGYNSNFSISKDS